MNDQLDTDWYLYLAALEDLLWPKIKIYDLQNMPRIEMFIQGIVTICMRMRSRVDTVKYIA